MPDKPSRADLQANGLLLQTAQTIQAGDLLMVQRGAVICAYREADGTLLWQRSWPDVHRMAASIAGQRIVLVQEFPRVLAPYASWRGAGQGPVVNRIVGLDLATGADAWTRSDATDGCTGYVIQPPLVHRDRVVVVSKLLDYPGPKVKAAANSELPSGFQFICLDPTSGATRWTDRTKDAGGGIDAKIWWTVGSYINARGELWIGYVHDHTGIDTATGKLLSHTTIPGRLCFWNRGVGDWKTTGFHWFNTVSRKVLIQGGVRPGCNDGLFFGYGTTYSYHHLCKCSKWIIGQVAMTAGELPVPLADGRRLEAIAPLQPGPEDRGGWRVLMGDAARSGRVTGALPPATASLAWRTPAPRRLPDGPISRDWGNDATIRAVTAPVLADGLVVVGRGHEHAVVAYDAATGTQHWRTVLGGRIDAPPALWRGHAYVGCRDGWVYALSLQDGSVRWRHLVASDRRQQINGSQLESLWPVLGAVIVHDGALYACAGRTSQFDGGLWVTRIDPVTGAPVWRSRVLGMSDPYINTRNEPLAMLGGRLWMDQMSFDPATGRGIDEVLVSRGVIDRAGKVDPGYTPWTPTAQLLPDPRAAQATTPAINHWGFQSSTRHFAGFSGVLSTMLDPGAATIHRFGTTSHWASDTVGHIRLGAGPLFAKGGSHALAGELTAWPADVTVNDRKNPVTPRWKVRAGSGAGLAMDGDRIAVVTSGSGKHREFHQDNLAPPRIVFHRRETGATDGEIALPGQVVWRGIAASDGRMAIAFEDGTVGLVR
jgi:outer membrane protein assembly factor BamB